MIRHQPRETWLASIHTRLEPVGDCLEWQGTMVGRVPVAYTPRGYLREGLSQGKHSVRVILWTLATGEAPAEGHVLRMTCQSDRCCLREHMVLMTRAESVVEQFRRGEHDTARRRAAMVTRARNAVTAKLTIEGARAIRASTESDEVLAQRHGIAVKRVRMVRRGQAWPETAPNSSVFTWRP